MSISTTLTPLTSEDATRFRQICHSIGYRLDYLSEALGVLTPPFSDRPALPQAVELSAGTTPFNILARLFFLGHPVEESLARERLSDWFCDTCIRCGLLAHDGTELRPQGLVVPLDDLLLASDLQLQSSQDDPLFVPPLCAAATNLRTVTINKPCDKALDLCSGFALHALIAGEFCNSVIATDLNPRAASFAEFNAALNNCPSLTAVTGDLYSPVQDERFDLILTSPPFIISPEPKTSFRFNPLELDGFVQKVLLEGAELLNEGGFLQCICEWVEIKDHSWRERLESWFSATDCDVWVIEANRQTPESYSMAVLKQTITEKPALLERTEQWSHFFEDAGVKAIHGGMVFLRKRSGRNWLDFTELSAPLNGIVSDAVENGFHQRDFALLATDQAVLQAQPALAPSLRQNEESVWKLDKWITRSIKIHVTSGIQVALNIDEDTRTVIELCDGKRTAQEVIEQFSDQIGTPAEEVQSQILNILRLMIKNAVLVLPSQD